MSKQQTRAPAFGGHRGHIFRVIKEGDVIKERMSKTITINGRTELIYDEVYEAIQRAATARKQTAEDLVTRLTDGKGRDAGMLALRQVFAPFLRTSFQIPIAQCGPTLGAG